MGNLYLHSDGNGGVKIGRGMIALITLIFLILSTTCVIAARSSKLNTEVIQMKEDIMEINSEMGKINDYKLESSVQLATIITKLENIEKKLDEVEKK